MENKSSDPFLVHAWLSARSIARGLPAPVSDYGGYRVDTNSATEIQRWVFPAVTEGLFELAHSIVQPGYFVKICGTPDRLREVLPQGWQVHPAAYFMMGTGTSGKHRCPQGYTVEVKQTMAVTHVRIVSDTGELAASGYAAQTNDAFIYDRIVSAPEHRRKGLGSLLMDTLRGFKAGVTTPELLVATEMGRALYQAVGWSTVSVFSTGSIESPMSAN